VDTRPSQEYKVEHGAVVALGAMSFRQLAILGEAAFHQNGYSSKRLFIDYVMGMAFNRI
jgi:hypothetical protein